MWKSPLSGGWWRSAISASRRVRFALCPDSETSSNVMPAGSAVVAGPDRQRARNPAAHSPVDTRTIPLSTGEAAARRRSNIRMAFSTLSAAGASCSPAALRRSPSGRRSNKVGPPKLASNAANRRAMVGWLSPSARPAARIEPSRATARNTRTSSQSIALRLDRGGRVDGSCRVSPPAFANPSRTAMTRSFFVRLDASTSDSSSYHQIGATKTFQRSPKTVITAIDPWRYDCPNTPAIAFPLKTAPRGIRNGHRLSAGKVRGFGGRRTRCPRGDQRVACAPWRPTVPGAAGDRISEILPRGGPRRALGRGTSRHYRWLRLQLDDRKFLVFVAALCQARHAGKGNRTGPSVENPNASR